MTPSFKPLNPKLYGCLQRNLPGGVEVFSPGEAFMARYRKNPLTGELRLEIGHRGEEYFGNCPFCGDTRRRLYVNHRWGAKDDQGNDNLFLCYCYNENCTSSLDGQLALKEMIYRVGRRRLSMQVYPGRRVRAEDKYDPHPPGPITYLDELPCTHPAVEYLAGERGFDVKMLVKKFGVGYCKESTLPDPVRRRLASNRIYIPIVMNKKLLGWQMRFIGTPPGKWPPKYWSCPGQPAGRMIYNFDRARRYRTVVVEEGPADVWSMGNQGMGLIGKSIGPKKLELLVKHCKDATVVLMLDPKQSEKEKAKGRPHHMEVAYEKLQGKFKGGVVKCYLPEEHDPGSLEGDYLQECIQAAAKEQGCKVQFGKAALLQ